MRPTNINKRKINCILRHILNQNLDHQSVSMHSSWCQSCESTHADSLVINGNSNFLQLIDKTKFMFVFVDQRLVTYSSLIISIKLNHQSSWCVCVCVLHLFTRNKDHVQFYDLDRPLASFFLFWNTNHFRPNSWMNKTKMSLHR